MILIQAINHIYCTFCPNEVLEVKDFGSLNDFIAQKESEEGNLCCHFVQPSRTDYHQAQTDY